MRSNFVLILKGMLVGAGKILPGVSGGMLAITLGLYDRGIEAISHFFKNIKENFKFLLVVGIGILISILFISKSIHYALGNFYLPTMLLFIGLMIGGIPSVIREAKKDINLKNIIIMLVPFFIIFGISLFSNSNSTASVSTSFFPIFLIGIVDAVTMIIPGISGTAILMLLGYYDVIITTLSSATDFSLFFSNLQILIPFFLGMIVGIIVLSKIISYLLLKHRVSAYFAIIGFSIASILMLLGQTFSGNYDILEVLFSLVMLIIGYFAGKKLDSLQ